VNRHLLRRAFPATCAAACALVFAQTGFAQFGAAAPKPAQSTGIDRTTADPNVRIQDDAFRAVEGKWLADTPIPADRTSAGGFDTLYEDTQPQLRELIETAQKTPPADPAAVADAKKVGDVYTSFMDEAKIDAAGFDPIKPDLAAIDAMKTKADVAAMIGIAGRFGVDAPFGSQVHQDSKDSTKYIFNIAQSGIALPDRDYFLQKSDKRFADVRAKYEAYLTKVLGMIGERDAAAQAKAIMALETRIAAAQWTRVENRDPVKTYNVVALTDLPKLAPHIDWSRYLDAASVTGKVDSIVVGEPSYFKKLDAIVVSTPMSTWKAYFKTRELQAFGFMLSKDFVDTRFAFFSTVVRGTPENQPRWKRGVRLVEGSVGEGLGRLYVAKYFPPESKARMDELVKNLLAAYKVSIDGLDWMSPATKKEAQLKLSTFMPKIGYPSTWRDYTALKIDPDDVVGNYKRAQEFEYMRNIDKLGQPIDRAEWGMTPQTINAYYNPELNEIVFPAAFLQPPFFNPKADDAVNYGAIGAVIGHEISHGFDDQGSQYDEKGNLRNWWTAEDHKRFAEKTKALIAQYNAYEMVGYHVNGALTLGENIADNSGLAIAYKAYHLSLGGKEAPVIDGLTGDQRFYMGFVQAWQEKNRDAAIIAQIKSDPHSPGEFRANGTLRNQPGFYEAFGIKPGDKMYVPPEKRVIIW
jgi:putative endopeptidase